MKMLKVVDLMQELDVSHSTLYEYIKRGLTPTLYVGRSPRWSHGALVEWLIAQHTELKNK